MHTPKAEAELSAACTERRITPGERPSEVSALGLPTPPEDTMPQLVTLRLAYWRDGQRDAAQKQLVALRAINNHNQGIAVLSKKLQANTPQSAVF